MKLISNSKEKKKKKGKTNCNKRNASALFFYKTKRTTYNVSTYEHILSFYERYYSQRFIIKYRMKVETIETSFHRRFEMAKGTKKK